MTLIVHCPACDSKIKAPTTLIGRKVRCPKCQQHFVVPNPEASVPVATTKPRQEPLVVCGNCGKELMNNSEVASQNVKCPQCGMTLHMPPLAGQYPVALVAPELTKVGGQMMHATSPLTGDTTCPMCRGRVKSGAKLCNHCGEILDPGLRDSENEKDEERQVKERWDDLSPGVAFHFAFRCRNWFSSAIIAGLLSYLPLVGRITVRGWRLEIARRVFAGDPEPLPGFDGFGNKMLDGLRLRLVWSAYQLPFVVANVFLAILPIIMIWAMVQGDSWHDAWARFKARVAMWAIKVVISLVLELWLIVGQLPFWAGMVRYLHSGRWFAFFEIIANGRLVFSHPGLFIVFFFTGSIAHFILKFVQAILIASGKGIVFVPLLTTPSWNWFRGHMWGQLARIIVQREQGMPE